MIEVALFDDIYVATEVEAMKGIHCRAVCEMRVTISVVFGIPITAPVYGHLMGRAYCGGLP
jgi:multisubunit Na+/H+ antiporter MnhG subunit